MMKDEDQEDELAEFKRAMAGVVPLKRSPRMSTAKRKSRTRATFARTARAAVVQDGLGIGDDLYEVQAGDELLFRRAGVAQTVLRRLRRGQYRVEAEMDMHGMIVTQAAAHLTQFLSDARARNLRCVRIIHGKGLRSGNRGPVLKNTVNALLRRSDRVLAFASARPVEGGTGATLVLLSRV